ncbi:MAG: tyrosine-type recombinase/integrase [bacterium]|nr:tyrosine-type recombinase/integrase [bacterium]
MRIGELVALRWKDIDFAHKLIEVNKSFSHGYETPPKNGKLRKVDISQQLEKTLLLWKANQQELYESLGKSNPELVFCTIKGNRINPNHFRDWTWHECLKKAGARYLKFHTWRHQYAAFLLMNGVSPV